MTSPPIFIKNICLNTHTNVETAQVSIDNKSVSKYNTVKYTHIKEGRQNVMKCIKMKNLM